jgi:hypothetical protein
MDPFNLPTEGASWCDVSWPPTCCAPLELFQFAPHVGQPTLFFTFQARLGSAPSFVPRQSLYFLSSLPSRALAALPTLATLPKVATMVTLMHRFIFSAGVLGLATAAVERLRGFPADGGQRPLLGEGQIEPPPESRKFSVGFSMHASYGAAAIIFSDAEGNPVETHTEIYRGNNEYRGVMKKLSLESNQHLA